MMRVMITIPKDLLSTLPVIVGNLNRLNPLPSNKRLEFPLTQKMNWCLGLMIKSNFHGVDTRPCFIYRCEQKFLLLFYIPLHLIVTILFW